MYAEFFSLRELPFNNTPDPRFFYSTPDHEEALASLIYAVKERKGFVLLTGEVGAGKTLISRMMLRHFNNSIEFAMINHAVENARDLMESVCAEFDIEANAQTSQTQLVRLLHDFLLAKFAQNVPVVLVLDEAQNLPTDAFEQLRMIGNLESDDAKLLQIAIVGQPELQQKFASAELRQLRQRIFRSFHLPSLDRQSTQEYICHRLNVVGAGEAGIFSSDAINRIYDVSRGLPRIINTICDNALLSAYSADQRVIHGKMIESVVSQMMLIGKDEQQTMYYPAPQTGQASHTTPQVVNRAAAFISQPLESVQKKYVEYRPLPVHHQIRHPAIESLASRVRHIKSQLDSSLAGDTNNKNHTEIQYGTISYETGSIKHTLMTNPDEVFHRLSLLERKYHATTSAIADAKSVHTNLEPLLRDALSIVTRVSTTVDHLKHRDKRLRNTSDTAENAIRELKKQLDRYELATAKNKKDGHHAQAIYDRLTTQAERSTKIVGDLKRIFTPPTSPADPVEIPQTAIHPPQTQ